MTFGTPGTAARKTGSVGKAGAGLRRKRGASVRRVPGCARIADRRYWHSPIAAQNVARRASFHQNPGPSVLTLPNSRAAQRLIYRRSRIPAQVAAPAPANHIDKTRVVVAADEIDRKLLVGDCKWRNSLNETETLSTLQDRRRMLPGYNAYECYESGGGEKGWVLG